MSYGPVHLALGRPIDRKEYWFVVSDEPTELRRLWSMDGDSTSKRTFWTIYPMAFNSRRR